MDQQITIASASDIGTVREENEDFHFFSVSRKFLVVCDGMGGHRKGAMASKIAGETLRDLMLAKETLRDIVVRNKFFDISKACQDLMEELPLPAKKLIAGVRLANRHILSQSLNNPDLRGMGTTLVAAVLHQEEIIIANVGDSRVYRLREGKVTCMTTDHSWLNELLEDEEISADEAEHFQKKNVLTRALGMTPKVKVDLLIETVEPGDLYLVCTDGLHNALSEELIQSVLGAQHGSLQNKINNLVKSAKLMDGADNITGGLIHLSGQWKFSNHRKSKYTFDEESEAVSTYLNQSLKSVYHQPTCANRFDLRKIATIGLLISILFLTAIFIYRAKTTRSLKSAAIGGAPNLTEVVKQAPSGPTPTGVTLQKGGQLVLLQVGAPKYIEQMQNLPGVRILDSLNMFNNQIPVYAGRYTWAIADSNERLLYKKKNILLKSLKEIEIGPNQVANGSGERSNNSHNARARRLKGAEDGSALVYIVGNFNSDTHSDAALYINNVKYGRIARLKDQGFYLRTGVYSFEIRSADDEILQKKSNVKIFPGETIAIEF